MMVTGGFVVGELIALTVLFIAVVAVVGIATSGVSKSSGRPVLFASIAGVSGVFMAIALLIVGFRGMEKQTVTVFPVALGLIALFVVPTILVMSMYKTGRWLLLLGVGVLVPFALLAGSWVTVTRVEMTSTTEATSRPAETYQEAVAMAPQDRPALVEVRPESESASDAPLRDEATGEEVHVPLVEVTPEQIVNSRQGVDEQPPEEIEQPTFVRDAKYDPNLRQLDASTVPAEKNPKLPIWVAQNVAPPAGGRILRSERFGSIDEARDQLWRQVTPEVSAALRTRNPDVHGWSPFLPELLHSGVVRRECIAEYPMEVGEFTTSVYEVIWYYNASDNEALATLEATWESQIVGGRNQNVLWAFFGATAALTLLGAALRRSSHRAS
ncbi:MAG: hypothetical protein KDA69_10740 [Planctomycetaceae bacterium]|nr:hypothetical protein [Planctomycetaceae bacterium]MCA9044788.1 hypothetical protein [Planctomycetaceae bacterium]